MYEIQNLIRSIQLLIPVNTHMVTCEYLQSETSKVVHINSIEFLANFILFYICFFYTVST